MMIQRFKWLGLMGLLALAGQTRVFAEEGAPSKSALAEMGLSSLSVMSDDEAMDIRGEGFKGGGSSASAWGSSWAFVSTPAGAAGSKNGYNAHGKNSASGDNLSFAGVTVIKTSSKSHGKPPKDGGGNGGYGGNKMSSSKGSKGGNGGYGGGGGGGDKGGHGGKTTTTTFIVFAGGSSHAHAH
jgi:hypothetical protein